MKVYTKDTPVIIELSHEEARLLRAVFGAFSVSSLREHLDNGMKRHFDDKLTEDFGGELYEKLGNFVR